MSSYKPNANRDKFERTIMMRLDKGDIVHWKELKKYYPMEITDSDFRDKVKESEAAGILERDGKRPWECVTMLGSASGAM